MNQDRDILIEDTPSWTILKTTLRGLRLAKLIAVLFIIFVFIIVVVIVMVKFGNKTTDKQTPDVSKGNCFPNVPIETPKPWVKSLCKDVLHIEKPCTNFEQYSCSGWKKRTNIPDGLYSWDRFGETGRKICQTIKERFDSGGVVGIAEIKAKRFFDQCMAETREKTTQTLESFRNYLTNIKGSELKETSYGNLLPEVLSAVNKHGVWPLFKLITRIHPDHPNKWILSIFPGTSPFSESITASLKLATPKQSRVMDQLLSKTKVMSPEEDVASSSVDKILKLLEAENTLILEKIWQMTDDCAFYKEMGISCPYLSSDLTRNANKLLSVEVDITLALIKGRNLSVAMNNYTIKTPNKLVSVDYLTSRCSSIDWKDYFRRLTNNWNADQNEILLLDETAVLQVCEVVSNYSSFEKRNTLINYLLFSLAKNLMNYYDSAFLFNDEQYDDEMVKDFKTNHWYRCMIRTNNAFGMATGSTYIRTISSSDQERSTNDIKNILSYVKKAYKNHIRNTTWLDDITKKRFQRKLDLMVDKIGYPSEIMNETYRDKLYEKLQLESDWFQSLVQWKKFTVKQMIDKMLKPVDRNRWVLTPATVNAEHDMLYNDINVPISLFQSPFYEYDRPMVMNFGAFGSVISHEITHAFGKRGTFYDEYGVFRDWLTNGTEENLAEKSLCLLHKYETFNINGYKANPNLTTDEDIADTVGIRIAYSAYQLWAEDNEEKIDNITRSWMEENSLTEDKLFFIAFSQNFCEKYTDKGLKKLSGSHSPGAFRIKGSLSDTNVFQKSFSCPVNSPYVFTNRCHVL